MKKQYTTPTVEIVKTTSSSIICVSFGEGSTNTMHSRDGLFDDEDDDLWDEF